MPSQEFKYVQPSHKKGPQKSQPRGKAGKAGKGGRIRVQAGDKRVPPSKSKPKNRQTVGPHEESTLNMDSVQWSEQHYDVKALAKAYSNSFPIMVRVTHGYYGELGTDVSIGQVIQIHSFGLQKRVCATDCQQRELSLPLDYPVEVTLLEKHDRVWMRLRDVVLSRPLPLKVRVMNMSHDAEMTTLNIVGEDLTITGIKEEIFLKGNSINDGWIDQVEIVLIPSFVHAAFSVALHMRGAIEEEWADFQGMYNRSVRHLNFNMMTGYSGIYVNGEDPYPLLGEVNHDTTRTKSPEPPPATQLYQNLPSNPPTLQSPTTPPLYDNLGYTNDEKNAAPVISHHDVSPHFANARDYPVNNITVETDVHAPPRAVTPFSEVDEQDVGELFDNVIKLGQETLERQQSEEQEKREMEEREQQALKAKEHRKRSELSNNNNRDLYANHIESSLVRKSRIASEQASNNPKKANELLNTDPQTSAGGPSKRLSSHKEPPRGSYVCETSSGTPMGVIQPTVLQQYGAEYSGKQTAESRELGKPSLINSIEDVPADVTSLTVEDICQCLKLMNMDSHISEFRTHQIDGKLLHDIKETVLLKEFHFTPFNASKLMRFVRGWRPKIS